MVVVPGQFVDQGGVGDVGRRGRTPSKAYARVYILWPNIFFSYAGDLEKLGVMARRGNGEIKQAVALLWDQYVLSVCLSRKITPVLGLYLNKTPFQLLFDRGACVRPTKHAFSPLTFELSFFPKSV